MWDGSAPPSRVAGRQRCFRASVSSIMRSSRPALQSRTKGLTALMFLECIVQDAPLCWAYPTKNASNPNLAHQTPQNIGSNAYYNSGQKANNEVRHLRAAIDEKGHYPLLAKCSAVEECAPGLFTVSKSWFPQICVN